MHIHGHKPIPRSLSVQLKSPSHKICSWRLPAELKLAEFLKGFVTKILNTEKFSISSDKKALLDCQARSFTSFIADTNFCLIYKYMHVCMYLNVCVYTNFCHKYKYMYVCMYLNVCVCVCELIEVKM